MNDAFYKVSQLNHAKVCRLDNVFFILFFFVLFKTLFSELS